MQRSVFHAAIFALGLAATSAMAATTVGHLTVNQSHQTGFPNYPLSYVATLFDGTPASSSFNTFDGHSGLVSTLTDTGGTLNARVNGFRGGSGYDLWGTQGVLNFDVTGTFSITPGVGSLTSGLFEIKNLDTNEFWRMSEPTYQGPINYSGTLSTTAAPAGHYQLNFDVVPATAAGQSNPNGFMSATLVITPEPVSLLSTLAGTMLLLRRRQ